MYRSLLSVVPAHPGTRVVYRDEGSTFFTEPILLWVAYRETDDGHPMPIDVVFGMTSNEYGVMPAEETNVIGYLAPGEEMDDDWWSRHGGRERTE